VSAERSVPGCGIQEEEAALLGLGEGSHEKRSHQAEWKKPEPPALFWD